MPKILVCIRGQLNFGPFTLNPIGGLDQGLATALGVGGQYARNPDPVLLEGRIRTVFPVLF